MCGFAFCFQAVFGLQNPGMGSQFGWNKSGYIHTQQPMPMPNYGGSGKPNSPYCGTQSRFMQPGGCVGGGGGGGGGPVQCRPNSFSYNSQFANMQGYPVSI